MVFVTSPTLASTVEMRHWGGAVARGHSIGTRLRGGYLEEHIHKIRTEPMNRAIMKRQTSPEHRDISVMTANRNHGHYQVGVGNMLWSRFDCMTILDNCIFTYCNFI